MAIAAACIGHPCVQGFDACSSDLRLGARVTGCGRYIRWKLDDAVQPLLQRPRGAAIAPAPSPQGATSTTTADDLWLANYC